MKKNRHVIILLVLLTAVSLRSAAQFRTISGTVVDEADNPIAGAKVQIPFTNKGTRTDANGKFSIPVNTIPKQVRVTSTGKNVALYKASEEMYIKMGDRSTAQWQSDDWHLFAGLDFCFFFSGSGVNGVYNSQRHGVTTRSLGIVAGMTDSRMGAYVKGHFIPFNDSDDHYEIDSKRSVRDFIVGGIVHVWEPIYANVGVGALYYTTRTNHYSDFGVADGYTDIKKKKIPLYDIGISGRYTQYQAHLGILTTFEKNGFHPYIGLSYLF